MPGFNILHNIRAQFFYSFLTKCHVNKNWGLFLFENDVEGFLQDHVLNFIFFSFLTMAGTTSARKRYLEQKMLK